MVPARVARLASDVLEAVLHHPPPAELGPAPRPAARKDVPEQVRDEQHAAADTMARRVCGEGDQLTLKMRWIYAQVLFENPSATLDDLREAVTSLEETERIARRAFGGAHPVTRGIGKDLETTRAALRARETPSRSPGIASD